MKKFQIILIFIQHFFLNLKDEHYIIYENRYGT